MDWMSAIQTMLDYIEAHLLEDIEYADIAKVIHISNLYCHQAFRILVGMTPTEYIRKRRLSLAGQELQSTDSKVIDIAYKYGFESPESFTKAFTRFHGINPRQAKGADAKLKHFLPISIEFRMSGGVATTYRVEQRPSFSVLLCERSFSIEQVNEDNNHDIPDFWAECWGKGYFDLLAPYRQGDVNYALCSPISKVSNDFLYGIGVMYNPDASLTDVSIPDGFTQRHVDSGLWAVFTCYGEDGNCMDDMWNRIYKEFIATSPYEMRDYMDFECYPTKKSNWFSEIWVPIQKKVD